jgi:Holliday junction resolvase RusA-like endonuclease
MDNIAKLVLDAMNKIVYADDAQVANIELIKRWGEVPGTRVSVFELVAED